MQELYRYLAHQCLKTDSVSCLRLRTYHKPISVILSNYCLLGHADLNLWCTQWVEHVSWCNDKTQTHKASGMLMFSGIISEDFPLLLPLLEFKHENHGNSSTLTVMTELLRLQSQRHKWTGIVILIGSKTARIKLMDKERRILPVAWLTYFMNICISWLKNFKTLMCQVKSDVHGPILYSLCDIMNVFPKWGFSHLQCSKQSNEVKPMFIIMQWFWIAPNVHCIKKKRPCFRHPQFLKYRRSHNDLEAWKLAFVRSTLQGNFGSFSN